MGSSEERTTVAAVLARNELAIFVESLIALTIVWQVGAVELGIVETISTPALVVAKIADLLGSGDAYGPLALTLRRTAFALLISVVVGTVFGLIVGWGEVWKRTFEDYILAGLGFPPLLGAVLAALWFGVSDFTVIVAAGLLAFPYLSQNVAKAVEDVDSDLLVMSSSYGVSRRRVLKRVVLRSILPEWVAGFRYTFAVTWKVVTVAEVVVIGTGVGYQIERQMSLFSMAGVLAWTIIFAGIVMVIEYGLLLQIERRFFEWRETVDLGGGR